MISERQIAAALQATIDTYRRELGVDYTAHVPRIAFEIRLALSGSPKPVDQTTVCDIGAGIGLFTIGCAALGAKRVILVDDFGDYELSDLDRRTLALHERHGIVVERRDVVRSGVAGLEGVDVFTSFASMEHWHNSPKRLFRELVQALPSGGAFVLGTPNCVNLRKRITVPFGVGKWTPMEHWYEPEVFRGHVREPDVDDLRYIARDLGLRNVRVHGRNWLGYYSRFPWVRAGTRALDRPLQWLPQLCSDIYMVGNKP
jgi:SAM-dependent methyltransferase